MPRPQSRPTTRAKPAATRHEGERNGRGADETVLVTVVGHPLIERFQESPAALTPHRARPVIVPLPWVPPRLDVPTVLLSYEAYCDTMYCIAEAGAQEIAWLGTVRELTASRFVIDHVILVPQNVSVRHCSLDPHALGRYCHELLRRDPQERVFLNRVRFWGHLHPDSVEPSGIDDDQMEVFNESPWFIRGICTRFGDMSFTFYDYAKGVKVLDCPWEIFIAQGERQREIARAVQETVSRRQVPRAIKKGGAHDT